MSFTQSIRHCFRHYASFSGRASLSEFWFFVAFMWLGAIVLVALDVVIFGFSLDGLLLSWREVGGWPFCLFIGLALTVLPYFAALTRRLHDVGWSGWHLVITLALYGLFAVFLFNWEIFLFAPLGVFAVLYSLVITLAVLFPGTEGENRYGAPT